jgi:hypothetical protein
MITKSFDRFSQAAVPDFFLYILRQYAVKRKLLTATVENQSKYASINSLALNHKKKDMEPIKRQFSATSNSVILHI